MGIFNALITAVSGLQAQSFALGNISGNIANSATIGFKRNDTTFSDLVSDSGQAVNQQSGSTRPLSRSTNGVQGPPQSSDVSTNMAISGDGYFVVGLPSGSNNGQPTFNGQSLYTRRGDFALNKDGYLVNGAGYYLKAVKVDPTTGNPVSGQPEPIQFNNDFLPARATRQVNYRANLPMGAAPMPGTLPVSPGVSGANQMAFMANSLDGGGVTAYDASGQAINVQLRWGKTSDAPPTWNLFYQTNAQATGAQTAWVNAGTNYTFNSAGQMNPPVDSTTFTAMTVNGKALGDVKMQFGTGGLTGYDDPKKTVQLNALNQDGYAAGQVNGVSIADGGRVVASYSNGQTLEVGRVQLASFRGQDALQKVDGGAFAQTLESGQPILGAAGKISGSATEGSNTDIATEFSKLIVTQQAYSANTRIVSTADQMMQEILNMRR